MRTSSKKTFCPTCRRPLAWSTENPYRPFCCARCKLIDLGAWADEKHRIPGPIDDGMPEVPDDDDGQH